jgi:hypothetical protein
MDPSLSDNSENASVGLKSIIDNDDDAIRTAKSARDNLIMQE